MDRQRLWDLARFCRVELLDADLITTDEYAELVSDSDGRGRLETYDQLRSRVAELATASRDVLASIEWIADGRCLFCGGNPGHGHTPTCTWRILSEAVRDD